MNSLIERVLQAQGHEAVMDALTPSERELLLYEWQAWARPNQLPPDGPWGIWLLLAGRGFGKTRSGGEYVRREVEAGRAGRIALIERTPAEARDVMIEGESGLLAICPPWSRPEYQPSKRRVVWPNGAIATIYTSWEPDMLRGPQHDLAWCEELAAWKYVRETWDNLMLGLRIGSRPRAVITTTPRPVMVLKEILANRHTVVTRGSTYDNLANLAPTFREQIVERYEGTHLGRQEIMGEVLEDLPGALWARANIVHRDPADVEMDRIIIGVDPAMTAHEDSDETGIVVSGRDAAGNGWVLADASGRYSPDGWARRVVDLYHRFGANEVCAESNQGGDLIRYTLHGVDPSLPVKLVAARHAKQVRADPIAAAYEQGRVFHVQGLSDLEDQMCQWVPEPGAKSPDRVDALVYSLTPLLVRGVRPNIRWLG